MTTSGRQGSLGREYRVGYLRVTGSRSIRREDVAIREGPQADVTPYPLGAAHEGPPHAIVPANTRYFEAGPVTVGLEYRVVNDSVRAARFEDAAQFTPLGTEFKGFSIHVLESATGTERLRFDLFPGQWHYHYIRPPHDNIRVGYDEAAFGPMADWALDCLTTRLPHMLATAGAGDLAVTIDPDALQTVVAEIRRLIDPDPDGASRRIPRESGLSQLRQRMRLPRG